MATITELAKRLETLREYRSTISKLRTLAPNEITNAVVIINGETISIPENAQDLIQATQDILDNGIDYFKREIAEAIRW